MSVWGTIFDIKELAVFDGPGIRTTVFLKGCPLKCMWCHNPEGLSFKPQIMRSPNGCIHCGNCSELLKNPEPYLEDPNELNRVIRGCPKNLVRLCGKRVTAKELVKRLRRDEDYLKAMGGGVTFSGGEPLGQPEFLLECLGALKGIHTCIETSGYAPPEIFKKAVDLLDYIMMDLKVIDEDRHIHYTGRSNRMIIKNLEYLKFSGKPFRIRIPVIPGVNDTEENFRETAKLLKGAKSLDFVELLPYHQTAGAKYPMVGLSYRPEFQEDQIPQMRTDIFEAEKITCRTM